MNKHLKRVIKTFGFAAAAIGSVTAFNKISFLMAGKSEKENYEYYNWTYGDVCYKVKGFGKPVLLIHSLYPSCSMAEWEEISEELSKTFKVYTIDMLGYGSSSKPEMTYTAFTYASLIKDFIENVIKEPAYLIASNNSSAAAVTAAKIHKDRILKLMLISPNGIEDPMAVNSSRFKRMLMEFPLLGTAYYNIKTSKSALSSFFEEEGFYSKEIDRSELINKFYKSAHSEKGSARYAFASFITNYMNMDITGYISNMNMPICIAWGEENTLNPISKMDKLKEIYPSARYLIFEETKIFPHIENKDEFIKQTVDFFN